MIALSKAKHCYSLASSVDFCWQHEELAHRQLTRPLTQLYTAATATATSANQIRLAERQLRIAHCAPLPHPLQKPVSATAKIKMQSIQISLMLTTSDLRQYILHLPSANSTLCCDEHTD